LIHSHKYTFTYAFDVSGDVDQYSPTMDAYHVWEIPTSYIIDQTGHIVAGKAVLQEDDILSTLHQLISPKPLSDMTPSQSAGEMGLGGNVISSANNVITVSATYLLLPGGKFVVPDNPRRKVVEILSSTEITNGYSGDTESSVPTGSYVNILGTDQGVGKKLIARIIQAYK